MAKQVLEGCALLLGLAGVLVQSVDVQTGTDRADSARADSAEDVSVPKQTVAVLQPTRGSSVEGTILLSQTEQGVRVQGTVKGLEPGKHGFHIHEFGDLRAADGTSAGGHYAPEGHKHGAPDDREHHAGDLGNIVADRQGVAKVDKLAAGLRLHFVVGRSIVVHAGEDDFESQPSGDAGPRVAVGVIGFAGPSEEASHRESSRKK